MNVNWIFWFWAVGWTKHPTSHWALGNCDAHLTPISDVLEPSQTIFEECTMKNWLIWTCKICIYRLHSSKIIQADYTTKTFKTWCLPAFIVINPWKLYVEIHHYGLTIKSCPPLARYLNQTNSAWIRLPIDHFTLSRRCKWLPPSVH